MKTPESDLQIRKIDDTDQNLLKSNEVSCQITIMNYLLQQDSYEMTRCYLFQELAITLAWPDYTQHFQELLMQKPWLKITSNSLELIFWH